MPTEFLYTSSTTAIAWTVPGGVEQRAYFQDLSGQIRENQRSGDHPWTGGEAANVVGRGKLFTPLAAVTWNSAQGRQGHCKIRVYYLSEKNILSELVYDGSWHSGGLDGAGIQVASNSKLAAVQWGGSPTSGPNIRVYYQKSNDAKSPIYEHSWIPNKGWQVGSNFGSSLAGTSIAAIAFGVTSIRVYFQSYDRTLVEFGYDSNKWYQGAFRVPDVAANVSIAAVTWGPTPSIRVYWQDGGISELTESAYEGKGWNSPILIKDASVPKPSLLDTKISAASWGSINIRVYFQSRGVSFQEWQWVPGSGWSIGAVIPTGSVKGW